MNPYIGITGFLKPEEISKALQVFPHDQNPSLMVWVLAT